MTHENFVYWLQGFFELSGTEELTVDQVKMIKAHLGYVFAPKTPTYQSVSQRSPSSITSPATFLLSGTSLTDLTAVKC